MAKKEFNGGCHGNNGYQRLFLNNQAKTLQELLDCYQNATKIMQDWHENQEALRLQGSGYWVPAIKDFLHPFNGAGIVEYRRAFGPEWGNAKNWRDWTTQAYRMGSQLIIEQDPCESHSKHYVRLWIGSSDEVPGTTPQNLVELRNWLDENPHDGTTIPAELLAAIDLTDPSLETIHHRDLVHDSAVEPYSNLPEAVRISHEVIQFVPKIFKAFTHLLEVAVAVMDKSFSVTPPEVNEAHARSQGALSRSKGDITNPKHKPHSINT